MQQIDAARSVVAKNLSVRETEKLVGQLMRRTPGKPARKVTDRDVLRLQEDLAQKLGTKVQIKTRTKGRGALVINYSSLTQLDAFIARLNR
jgi:ParB family chromosome partitioning protein